METLAVNPHKYTHYNQGNWRMATWWSLNSETFNVLIRHYNDKPVCREIKLYADARSRSCPAPSQAIIKAALGMAIKLYAMPEEVAMEFEAATENESEAG